MKTPAIPTVVASLALCLALVAVACTSVPDTGRKQVNFLKPSEEAAMGFSEFNKMKQSKRISTDPNHNALVRKVGIRLSKVMPVPNAEWEFVVFEDDTPNAFALPGGKVGVHTGLFKVSKTEGGLAAVIGHEVAHVVARHSGERLSQGIVAGVAAAGVAKVMQDRTGINPAIAGAAVGGGTLLATKKFNRDQELEADKLGALYMARAGYHPGESVELWKRFAAYRAQSGGNKGPAFLSTHPVDSVRIAELERFMPQAMAEYKGGQ